MNLGKSINIACAMHGIQKKDLAERVGMSTVTISALANNRGGCRPKTLRKLAAAFKMPVSEFIKLGERKGKWEGDGEENE